MKFGQLQITSDLNYVISNFNNCELMCLSTETQNAMHVNGIEMINGVMISPPFESIMCMDMESYTQTYYSYLSTNPDAGELLAIIFKAISLGKNILMYITPDEACLEYPRLLVNYIYENFGIVVGVNGSESFVDPANIFNSFQQMYLYNLITNSDILDIWFAMKTLPGMRPETVTKLAMEIKPFGIFNTLDDYYNYFKELCSSDSDTRLEVAFTMVNPS